MLAGCYLYIIQSDNGGFSSWKVPLVETTYGFSNKGYPPLSGHMIWWSTLGAKNQCRQEHQMSTVFSMFWFFDVCILNLNEPLLSLYIYIYHYISPSNPYSHVCLVGHHFAIKILVAIIGYNWTILHRKGNTHSWWIWYTIIIPFIQRLTNLADLYRLNWMQTFIV